MTSMRYTIFMAAMLACSVQAQAVDPTAGWLSTSATEAEPYTFSAKTETAVTLPDAAYPGWSVFNAPSASAEVGQSYTLTDDTDEYGPGWLRFGTQFNTAPKAFLALGISENAGDADQTPLSMLPIEGKVLVHNVYARVRFVECAVLPDINNLKEMYPSFDESQVDASGNPAAFTAAKLGVCVDHSGYFCLARVLAGTEVDAGTGLPQDYTYEFCQSEYAYADVGGGEVIIRIEFNTYLSASGDYRRAYRIFAKDAKDANAEEVCLTKNRGYPWLIQGGNYQFDFKQVEKGEWFYALDDAIAASLSAEDVITKPMLNDPLDSLSRLAFSASDGGFYGAWLEEKLADDVVSLAAYGETLFTPYMSDSADLFSLYVDWATRYDVTLTDYLTAPPTTSAVTLSAATEASALETQAFNAFLLYMDPETTETLRLNVTGIVPREDDISFTLTGPEGCNLREALSRAAQLRIFRSADLTTFTEDTTPFTFSYSDGGTVMHLSVKKKVEGVECPFLQATLVSVADAE